MFAIGPCAHAQMCCPSTIDVSCDGELTADCSKCASTCLYCSGLCTGGGVTPFNDTSIKDAVKAWCDDPHSAAGVYGNISAWDTSEVTDMSWLFAAPYDDDYYIDDDDPSNKGGHCSSYATFNEDLSK